MMSLWFFTLSKVCTEVTKKYEISDKNVQITLQDYFIKTTKGPAFKFKISQ